MVGGVWLWSRHARRQRDDPERSGLPIRTIRTTRTSRTTRTTRMLALVRVQGQCFPCVEAFLRIRMYFVARTLLLSHTSLSRHSLTSPSTVLRPFFPNSERSISKTDTHQSKLPRLTHGADAAGNCPTRRPSGHTCPCPNDADLFFLFFSERRFLSPHPSHER